MDATQSTLRIVSTWPPPPCHGPHDQWIFCPWLQGLPRRSRLWIVSLPVHDANAVLLDAIGSSGFRSAPLKPAFVGVCLVDPFRQLKQVFRIIASAGVSGVVNLPTTGAFSGSMARSLDDLGTGVNREIAMLALARDQGLRIGGVAMTAETAGTLIDIGCEFVLNVRFSTGTGDQIESVVCPTGHPGYDAEIFMEENGETIARAAAVM